MVELIKNIDHSLFVFLNTVFANPLFDIIFPFITEMKHWTAPLLVIMAIFIVRKKLDAVTVILLTILSVAIADPLGSQIIKPLFKRLRPCNPTYFVDGVHQFLDGARFLYGQKDSLSFPSNHSMNVFTAAVVLTLFYPKNFVWFYVPAILVAFSRIYVGVHYPLDIFGGFVFGTITGIAVYSIYMFVKTKIINRKKVDAIIRNVDESKKLPQ